MNVSFDEYTSWDAINFSRLKPIAKTASKCKYELDNPKQPTPAMILGSALHVATLEPSRFETMFHICPPCDRRTAEGKEFFRKEEQKAGKKLLIRQGSGDDAALLGDVENLRGMSSSIRASKAASQLLDCAGHNEVSALWKDEETGLFCKARFDRYLPKFSNRQFIVELKSDRDVSEWSFGKTVDSRLYCAQAASYRHGLETITREKSGHVFIAVENFAPFDCHTFILDDPDFQTGLLAYRSMLKRYAECKASGKWPGYEDKVKVLRMPDYARERSYED
jgi:exodeoxyribonuclease VIII